MKKGSEKGITLIALVVTIVVLLILAGISISMLTGENGVITQARNAKEATEQAKVEELVSVALGSVISKNNGSTSGITPKMIADQINEDERRSDVYAENETTFPTNIIFPKENRKAEANLKGNDIAKDSMYNKNVNEADIAPVEIFDYEIINNGETGALTLDNLPTRTVRITKIKNDYCNGITGTTNTNYEIIYNGNKISETLIIPYQVDGKYVSEGIEGEMYRIEEVNLRAYGKETNSSGYSWPMVNEVVYPNTVKKIYGVAADCYGGAGGTGVVSDFVLPANLEEIGNYTFKYCTKITSITIPNSVTSIGVDAFGDCDKLTTVNYMGTEEEWNNISIASGNSILKSVKINYNYKGNKK